MSSNLYYISNERSCIVSYTSDEIANIEASFKRWLYNINLFDLVDAIDDSVEERTDDYNKTGYCMPRDWMRSLIDELVSYATIEEIIIFLNDTLSTEDDLRNLFCETLYNIIVVSDDFTEVNEAEYRVWFPARSE